LIYPSAWTALKHCVSVSHEIHKHAKADFYGGVCHVNLIYVQGVKMRNLTEQLIPFGIHEIGGRGGFCTLFAT
jgi:hypothetical protein